MVELWMRNMEGTQRRHVLKTLSKTYMVFSSWALLILNISVVFNEDYLLAQSRCCSYDYSHNDIQLNYMRIYGTQCVHPNRRRSLEIDKIHWLIELNVADIDGDLKKDTSHNGLDCIRTCTKYAHYIISYRSFTPCIIGRQHNKNQGTEIEVERIQFMFRMNSFVYADAMVYLLSYMVVSIGFGLISQ